MKGIKQTSLLCSNQDCDNEIHIEYAFGDDVPPEETLEGIMNKAGWTLLKGGYSLQTGERIYCPFCPNCKVSDN